MSLLEVVWNFEPRIIPSWEMPVWYGITWAMGFLIGYWILNKMLKSENAPEDWMDKILLYTLAGGILGARLGHCLFYQPDYYLANPLDILKIWEGGLASHGGAIGIIISSYILSKKVTHKGILWNLDRLVVPTAFAGFLIRMGNLFNHEIVGKATGTDYGFKFLRHDIPWFEALEITGEKTLHDAYTAIANKPQFADILAAIPNRHPAQLYEAICYLIIFAIMMGVYWKTNAAKLKGFLLGLFFILIFGARFVIEFFKENQDGIDQNLNTINMGQILSIPLVLFGVYLVGRRIKSLKKGKESAA